MVGTITFSTIGLVDCLADMLSPTTAADDGGRLIILFDTVSWDISLLYWDFILRDISLLDWDLTLSMAELVNKASNWADDSVSVSTVLTVLVMTTPVKITPLSEGCSVTLKSAVKKITKKQLVHEL